MNNKTQFKLDFLGLGAQRAATTWIAECLREHPEVCLANPKELKFFEDPVYDFGLDWYQKHFNVKRGHKFFGEFTSTYIYSSAAARRIKGSFPNVKLIVSLRNPVNRFFSHLPIKVDINSRDCLVKHKDLIDKGFYFKHLQTFLSLFPRENILIMIYEDIKKDPQKFMSRIYQFIGAESNFSPPSLLEIINPKKRYKAPKIKRAIDKIMDFVEGLKIGPIIKRVLIKIGVRRAFYFVDKKNAIIIKKYEIPDGKRQELSRIYTDDVRQLSQFLGRELWKDTFA